MQQIGLTEHGNKKQDILSAMPLAGMNFLGTVISLILIERLGRRKLLLISLSGVIITLLTASFGFVGVYYIKGQ